MKLQISPWTRPIMGAAILAMTPQVMADSVYSPIVGIVRTEVAKNSDALLAPCLNREPVATVRIDSVDGNVVTIDGNPGWGQNEFKDAYYVRVRKGDNSGSWATITANEAETLTLNPDGVLSIEDGFEAGDLVDVIPHWTLEKLMEGTALEDESQVMVYSRSIPGTNNSAELLATYYVGFGWYENATELNDMIIMPDESFILRNNNLNDVVKFSQIGLINESRTSLVLSNVASNVAQDIHLSVSNPIPVSISEVFEEGTSSLNNGDQILTFSNREGSKDNSASNVYTYYEGIWYDVSIDAGLTEITPGIGLVYRKSKSNSDSDLNIKYGLEINN